MSTSFAPGALAARGIAGVALVLLCPFLVLAAPRGDTVAVVGGPARTMPEMARIVAGAGGDILRAGAADNVIIARSGEPGYVLRLYAEGAWLVLDPIVATLCGADLPPRHRPPTQAARATPPS
ncbi:hypothetical protein [Methylobacterium iners]|uniref:Uncharacterized protein n=1 Tax=Methylobacterium iners TaxID=418707 RepID=A0ABQ4RZB8_9HYPH|nr:hypothetical protein [Methylobacterium iners]GJD96174.1 hypothetical protein OCOJLMKI_3393 [Methylobacterium iners]